MRVCYFGTYTMEEGYPRNRVIIEGLRKNGAEVIECHAELWKGTSEKLQGIKDGFSVFKQSARILRAYLKLINQYRRVGNYDALIVGYAGHVDIFLAKLLNLFRKKPLIFDAFLSLYDTAVMDRKIVSQSSLKAKLLWWVDRWACRMADAVLLDTQAHVDYFVREFHLPAEKFHAIPVGSYLAPPESYRAPLSQEPATGNVNRRDRNVPPIVSSNPPLLQRGDSGDFNVLYFGSYIPLHGVDVILEAAKIVQENKEKGGKGGFEHGFSDGREDSENRRDRAVLAFFASLNASTASEAKNVPPIADRRGFLTPSQELSDDREIVFTLIGTGQLLPAMKELASRLELKNVIFIDRFVREEDLTRYIMEADICLGIFGQTDKASRVIPCKVYNCLSLGKPLITMSSPATEGVLTHRENAILCRPGDPAVLSEAVLSLKNDKILREKIAHNGQEYFEKNFSAGAIGKKVIDIISKGRTGLA